MSTQRLRPCLTGLIAASVRFETSGVSDDILDRKLSPQRWPVDFPRHEASPHALPMIVFLRRLVAHLSASRPTAAEGGPLPIYAGGFTRLDLPKTQAAAVRNAIAWINRDPGVVGADFHLHQPDLATTGQALTHIRSQIPAKPMVVTELSLVWK